jgi:hypothetical protein
MLGDPIHETVGRPGGLSELHWTNTNHVDLSLFEGYFQLYFIA